MTVLLFLSALLSALSGAGGQARAPQAAIVVARIAATQAQAVAPTVARVGRPFVSAPAAAALIDGVALRLARAGIERFGARRRE